MNKSTYGNEYSMIRFCSINSPDLKLSCKTYWYIRIVNSHVNSHSKQSSSCQALAVTRMTSTSSWKSLQKPRQSTTIVELPVNTAFPNPWWENCATSNMSCFLASCGMTAKRASMGRYRTKDPELDQQLAEWFSDQRTQGKHLAFNLDLYWWIVINVSEPRSLRCDVYI